MRSCESSDYPGSDQEKSNYLIKIYVNRWWWSLSRWVYHENPANFLVLTVLCKTALPTKWQASYLYQFSGRTQRSNIQGSIHVKMWLSTRENRGLTEEEGMWNEIWQHQQIYTILLRHQLLHTKVSKSLERHYFSRKWEKALCGIVES